VEEHCDKEVENMEQKTWREKYILGRLDVTLVLFELVLSALFLLVAYLTGNAYFRGVGVGLIIAWVTSALAIYILKKKTVKS
jgi:hypothetical protein